MVTAMWILGILVFGGLLAMWPGFRRLVGKFVYAVLEQLRYFY